MGTQGIVSVTVHGFPLVKAVVGCNGMRAHDFARIIERQELDSLEAIYDAALRADFGCEDCLVVQTSDDVRPLCAYEDMSEGVAQRYIENFLNPTFNPRWKKGTAAHIVTVEATWLTRSKP